MLQDLRATLVQNHVRVIDLFRQWDEDESGRIDRTEFRKGLLALGIKAPREELDALFGSFDLDRSGQLDFRELNAALRREADALPPCRLVACRRRRARERLGMARAGLLRLEPERDCVAAGRRRRRRGASESRGRRRGVLLRATTPPITRRPVQRVAAARRQSILRIPYSLHTRRSSASRSPSYPRHSGPSASRPAACSTFASLKYAMYRICGE